MNQMNFKKIVHDNSLTPIKDKSKYYDTTHSADSNYKDAKTAGFKNTQSRYISAPASNRRSSRHRSSNNSS